MGRAMITGRATRSTLHTWWVHLYFKQGNFFLKLRFIECTLTIKKIAEFVFQTAYTNFPIMHNLRKELFCLALIFWADCSRTSPLIFGRQTSPDHERIETLFTWFRLFSIFGDRLRAKIPSEKSGGALGGKTGRGDRAPPSAKTFLVRSDTILGPKPWKFWSGVPSESSPLQFRYAKEIEQHRPAGPRARVKQPVAGHEASFDDRDKGLFVPNLI